MKLTVSIDGREAIPVRAISFAAGVEPFTRKRHLPPSLIWESALQAADIWPDGCGIPSLRLYLIDENGNPVAASFDYLESSACPTDLLPENDDPINKSSLRLPAGIFAYIDELQRFIDWLYPPGAHDGTCRDALLLSLDVQLPSDIGNALFDGFADVSKEASPVTLGSQAAIPEAADESCQPGTEDGSEKNNFDPERIWKKGAMVKELIGIWLTINGDLSEASRSKGGLKAANVERSYWDVEMCIKWATSHGKIRRNQATKNYVLEHEGSNFATLLKASFPNLV